jgi:hypothetical protein
MTQGCLIFAYDGDILYGPQAVLAACLVRKHLNIPVSLVTDATTMSTLKGHQVFENIYIREVGDVTNTRIINDTKVIWKNTNRSSAYDITPYDRTLVIDSDFLVLSDRLTHYLNSNADFMICPNMQDLHPDRTGSQVLADPASVPMLWATNIVFNKTPEVAALFNLVEHIRENWIYYCGLYKFNSIRFRNDYAFTIACHTLGGFGLDKFYVNLPEPVWFTDKDQLVKISGDTLTWAMNSNNTQFVRTQGQDIHMMNKHDLLNNIDQLMELAHD